MSADQVATYVALLRGVNVGGKNKMPIRDLFMMFTLAGCEAVETYIQSGNVVFKAGALWHHGSQPSSPVESRSASAIG